MKAIYKIVLIVLLSLSSTDMQATCNWKARIQQFTVTQNCSGTFKTINGSVFLSNTSGIQYYWSVQGALINWVPYLSTYQFYPASNGTYVVLLKLTDNINNCDTTISKSINFTCLQACDWDGINTVSTFVDSCKSDGSFVYNNSINGYLRTNASDFGKFQTQWYVNNTLKQTGGYYFQNLVMSNGAYTMCVNLSDTTNNCDTTICHTFNVTCVNNCNWKSKNIYLYATDSCNTAEKKFYVKGAVLMNGTPDLSYRYQYYINNVSVGNNYYSHAARVYNKGNYQICVKITDTIKQCDTTICKTVLADCMNCSSFMPQIDAIVMTDSCGTPGSNQFVGVVGKLKFRNPAAYGFYQIKWWVDTTSSSVSSNPYMRHATSNGFKRVCVQILDTLNGCDTSICRNVYVDCNSNSIQTNSIQTLAFYPNPASQTISFPELQSPYHYACYDAAGRLLFEGHSEPGLPISVAHLNNGVYALKVWSDNLYYTARFVKQDN